MLLSDERFVQRLSKHQRDLLVEHVREDMRPFKHDPEEARSRGALLARGFLEWVPEQRSRLGCPDGTKLTELGREAVCMVLGSYIDSLCKAAERRTALAFTHDRQAAYFNLLAESIPHWRREARNQTLTATQGESDAV